MLARPKSGDTEDDLLRFQEDFLRNRGQDDRTPVAATLVRVDKRKAESEQNRPKHDAVKETNREQVEWSSDSVDSSKRVKFKVVSAEDDQSVTTEIDESHIQAQVDGHQVLMDIVERDTGRATVVPPVRPSEVQPFPRVLQCEPQAFRRLQGERRSIFAKQLHKMKGGHSLPGGMDLVPPPRSSGVGMEEGAMPAEGGGCSIVVDGTGLDRTQGGNLAQEIHEENVRKLASMSPEEITRERRRLMESLDSKLLEFLTSKRRSKVSVQTSEASPAVRMDVGEALPTDRRGERNAHSEAASTMDLDPLEAESVAQHSNDACDTTAEVSVDGVNIGNEELPISLSEASKWLNMYKVEKDKLAWMTSLPEPRPVDPKVFVKKNTSLHVFIGQCWVDRCLRFDFEGYLVSSKDVLPVHRGLHHHGDEPEVPGYTLEELFVYSRSSMLQQKILGLNTLAKILQKNGEGLYDECLTGPVLPQLLDAGLVLLIRWSLDDNVMASVVASVGILHGLLVNPADEYFLGRTFSWNRGHELPFLRPAVDEAPHAENVDAERELTDAELVKLDVVKGLIRMDVLPRLRYVLEVLRPPAPTVVHVLGVLGRLASHSLTTATLVARHPRLLATIVVEFMPKLWTSREIAPGMQQASSAYGVPMHEAVKLIRILASAGHHLAEHIVDAYDIMSSLLCYMSVDPSSEPRADSELLNLCLESFRTWRVFLTYGVATQHFLDFFPLLARQLQYYQTLCLNIDVHRKSYDYDHASELIGMVTAVLPLAGRNAGLQWNQVAGLQPTIELCFKKWLWEFSQADKITFGTLKLLGTALGFVTTFYRTLKMQVSCNTMEMTSRLDDLFSSSVVPFLKSRNFADLLSGLREHSMLLCETRPGTERDPPTLLSVGTVLWGGCVAPILKEESPFSVLGHVLDAFDLMSVHGRRADKVLLPLFRDEAVTSYVRDVASQAGSSRVGRQHWFSRFEVHFLCRFLAHGPGDPASCHCAGLAVVQLIRGGDLPLGTELMKSVIFNIAFVSEVNDVEGAMRQLCVDDQGLHSRVQLLRRTCSNLASICSTYTTFFQMALDVQDSVPTHGAFHRGDSLATYHHHHLPKAPTCEDPAFLYLPVRSLFARVLDEDGRPAACQDDLAGGDAHFEATCRAAVIHCLQFCHLVHCWRADVCGRCPAGAHFLHLAAVFLIGTDLFLDVDVRDYLEDCLLQMAQRGDLSRMDLERCPVPHLASFRDFYERLLEQFGAVSYGNPLFGSFVLVPLQMCHPVALRRLVWSEHVGVLRALGVRPNDLPVSLGEFLHPTEDDLNLVSCYLSALLNGQVRPNWCPVPYWIAVHHVHAVLYGGQDPTKARSDVVLLFRNKLEAHQSTVVYKHVTEYDGLGSFGVLATAT